MLTYANTAKLISRLKLIKKGGTINSNQAESGPIYFREDQHPIQFHNIVITPAK